MVSHNSFTQDDWEERALAKNLELLGEVKENHLRVRARCLVCKVESEVIPKDIHRSSGCPNCRKRKEQEYQLEKWQEFAETLNFRWANSPPSSLRDREKTAVCNLCGGIWRVNPRTLYTKTSPGHPRCPKIPNKNAGKLRGAYKGGDSLEKTHGALASEWHPTKNQATSPKDVSKGSSFLAWWIGQCGHEWPATVASRSAGRGCPICANQIVVQGVNSLATTHPELLKSWDFSRNTISPDAISWGSSKAKVWWLCELGHPWEATPVKRANGQGCPTCSNNEVHAGINSLATTHPELLKSWDFSRNTISPDAISWGSSKAKVWWLCELGHPWEATPVKRANGQGCPICAGNIAHPGINDLESLRPEIALTWDTLRNRGKEPSKTKVDSKEKFWWVCEKKHQFRMSVSERVSGGVCSLCNQAPKHPESPISETHPNLAAQWHPVRNGEIRPENVSSGSRYRAWWICAYGHEWDAVIPSRVRGNNCPICSNQKILVGFNDLASTHPELLSSWDFERNIEIAPTDLSSGSTRVKVWWKCEAGHPWRTSVPKRIEGQGCPTCAKSGFDPNSPGYMYFVWHEHWEMYQIGITNYPKKRLASHRANGFELLEIRGPMEGHLTARWETALLRFLKRNGADLGNQKIAGKFDGFTESWTAVSYRAESLKALMDLCDATEIN